MSYDIQGLFIDIMQKQRIPLLQTTPLQGKILKHICTTKNADYLTIMRHTHRGRVTALQSLESLVKHKYVEKKKIYPDRKKSKLTFKPTQKGIFYSLAFLDTDYDEVLSAHADAADMTEYNQRIRLVPDYYLRKKLVNYFSRFILEEDYFTIEGNITSTASEDMINLGLRIGLLYSTRDKSFNFRNLFDPKSVEFLKNIYTTEEQRAFKRVLMKIKENIDTTIEQLPD